uniref:Peter pan homolog n=1 Tax=Cyprinus carpio TaxID=7962 RepID=A0A8C1ZES5_CYPCA
MGKTKTKNQKKGREAARRVAEETFSTVPHTFVFQRGQIGRNVGQLVLDMRRVMEPFTARSLKVRKKNVLKDFVAVAGPLGITHFSIFTKTENSINMRLARLPKGPTLYFHVAKYALIKDVISSLKRHRMHEQQFSHHPLLVLNNFGIEGMHIKLMATMFQNMFPSINVHKVLNLNSIKRCVLLNYDPVSQEVEFRHYSLKVVPVGMSRGVKKLMQEKFPNMSKLEDISELLMKGVNLSESEAEQDGDHNITELPQVYSGRGNMASQQSAVRLTEIGPRMTLQLVKIVEGMGEGKVLYHSFVSKTEEELQEILKRKEARLKEKEERKRKQEQNIALKKEKRDQNKKRSLEGIKRKRPQEGQVSDDEVEDPGIPEDQAPAEESEDEAEYYRQAVGEEPDQGIMSYQIIGESPDRGSKDGRKRFGDRKPLEGRNRFRKSDGGKKFGQKGGKGSRFAGQKKRDAGKKFGGQKSFKGRAVMKRQKGWTHLNHKMGLLLH